jgi:hypothetical protein
MKRSFESGGLEKVPSYSEASQLIESSRHAPILSKLVKTNWIEAFVPVNEPGAILSPEDIAPESR